MRLNSLYVVAALVLASACSSRQEKAEQFSAAANALVAAGDFEGARKEILKAVYQYESLLGKLRSLKKPIE